MGVGKSHPNKNAHPGNRTLVSTVGGYYDTTTPDALLAIQGNTTILNLSSDAVYFFPASLLLFLLFCLSPSLQLVHRNEDANRQRTSKSNGPAWIVGLTGGIASGKSIVSNLFKAHGIPVVDADLFAQDVLKEDTGGWKKVVSAFGEDILQPNGEVDRPKLGQIVFSNSEGVDFSTESKGAEQTKSALEWIPIRRYISCNLQFLSLCRLLAPYMSSRIFWETLKLWMKGFKVIVLDVPLSFEAKMDKWTKPIIVVWVDPETQIRRLMLTNVTSEDDARNRINAQMSLDLKRTSADNVIDNAGSLEDLKEQFQNVLFEVAKPLTWTEFGLSKQGAMPILVSIIVGVLILSYIQKSL